MSGDISAGYMVAVDLNDGEEALEALSVLGDGHMPVVGESFQELFQAAADEYRADVINTHAFIVRDRENRHDVNAAKVLVILDPGPLAAGFLPRDLAARFRGVLDSAPGPLFAGAEVKRGSADVPWGVVLRVDWDYLEEFALEAEDAGYPPG